MTAIVHCPVCRQKLELDREFLGREVECGACGRPFIAGTGAPQPEPEVIYTTPIDDDGDYPRGSGRPVTSADITTLGWGICSLVIGMLGILLLPISLCCSLGLLGTIVSGLGLLCGIAGMITNPVPHNRGIAITGTVINLVTFIICTAMFFHFVVKP